MLTESFSCSLMMLFQHYVVESVFGIALTIYLASFIRSYF